MPFETPATGKPEQKKPAPEVLKRGMMEAGRMTFRDTSRSSEVSRKTTLESGDPKKTVLESFGFGDGFEEGSNEKAAFEALVSESGVSWEVLQGMNEGVLMKDLAREYLEAWRSIASDKTKRVEAVREKLRNAVKDRLQ